MSNKSKQNVKKVWLIQKSKILVSSKIQYNFSKTIRFNILKILKKMLNNKKNLFIVPVKTI